MLNNPELMRQVCTISIIQYNATIHSSFVNVIRTDFWMSVNSHGAG